MRCVVSVEARALSPVFSAVTLDGTIIHKSGLMTGGRSTHGNGKKWEEKDVQGQYLPRLFVSA